MIPINRSSFGRAGGRLAYLAAPKSASSWPRCVGRSRNIGPPPMAHPLHINRSPNPRIQIHALHPSAFPLTRAERLSLVTHFCAAAAGLSDR